jgi:CRISPR-associated protein Cpf1
MEDLDPWFKRDRTKIEKQVYQKFERMLIDKLNYLALKGSPAGSPGGVLRGYQLTAPFKGLENMGRRSGILFYVPAEYTTRIDPTTGFADLFNWSAVNTKKEMKEFIGKFDSIYYDMAEKLFAFSFDYRNYGVVRTGKRTKWTAYAVGEWSQYDRKRKERNVVIPNERLKSALAGCGIRYEDGSELIGKIIGCGDPDLTEAVFTAFKTSLSLRKNDKVQDEIISPVKNSSGTFFRSSDGDDHFPADADANGAYHIALKGLMTIEKLEQGYDQCSILTINPPIIDTEAWLEYIQSRDKKCCLPQISFYDSFYPSDTRSGTFFLDYPKRADFSSAANVRSSTQLNGNSIY